MLESKERPEDLDIGRWHSATNLPVMAVATKSGFSAAAIGPFEKAQAEALVSDLIGQGLVPSDAYLSSGNGFTLRLR